MLFLLFLILEKENIRKVGAFLLGEVLEVWSSYWSIMAEGMKAKDDRDETTY